ncbi:WD40 repeat domain-containing protein [Spirillospora sp. CA-128828]|uniref:WD40 repeat domain-containing protein n=1 Tax=Spirillospora sp. CA-128828 TaxID=3240033 RepID=UPI003D936524
MPVVAHLTAGRREEFACNVLTIIDDGRRALGGFADGTVCLWDIATGVRRYSARVHEDGVSALAVTSDETTAVSGGYDGSLCVWHVETGEIVHRLRPSDRRRKAWQNGGNGSYQHISGAASMVGRILVAPDDRTVIAGAGTDVELWDLETGDHLTTLTGHRNLVVHPIITASGDLVTADGMREWAVWSEASDLLRDRLRDRRPRRRDHLVSTDITGVHLHDPATGELVASVAAADDTPEQPAVTSDGGFAVVPAPGNSYIIKAVTGGEVVGGFKSDRTLKCHIVDWRAENIAVSVPGGYVLEGLMSGVVRVHRLGSEKDSRRVPHADIVGAVAFAPDGRTAITASRDTTLGRWDVDTGACTRHKYTTDDEDDIQRFAQERAWWMEMRSPDLEILAMAVTPDGRTLAGGWSSGAVTLWDARSGERTGVLLGHQSFGRGDYITAIGTGDDLVTAASGRSVRAWHPSDGREVFTTEHDGDAVITPSGSHALIPCGEDFHAWEIATGTLVAELTGARNRALRVGDSHHLSSDGRTAVLYGDEIEIWDLTESRMLHRLSGPRQWNGRREVTADGGRLIDIAERRSNARYEGTATRHKGTTARRLTWDSEPVLTVWDLRTGTRLHETRMSFLPGRTALSRSGRLLLAHDGRTLAVWDLEHAAELGILTFGKSVSHCVINPARETEFMVVLESGEVVCLRQVGVTS